ncbi:uncharacterized protein LOC132716425, partial [Ruditapes philippinarum]|uniref:uncharacterized protein LOC132716425 n=1 Tax=Ruditapes philippinarum TaxID=129788 RepID=UPI00295B5D28
AAQETKTLTLKVIKKSTELITYKNGSNEISYFNIIGANGTDIHHIRVYQRHKFCMVRVGVTLKIVGLIKKGESWWCVSSRNISYAKPVNTYIDNNQVVLPEDEPVAGSKRSIKDALDSPQKSTVVAKVLKVSPLKFQREGSLAVRSLGLKDESGTPVKVSLFGKLAAQEYVPNSVIQLTSVYNKVYNSRQQLTATKDTHFEYVANHKLQNVSCTSSDGFVFNDDPDFNENNDKDCLSEDMFVTSIYDLALYDAGTNSGCRKKKLQGGKCPSCNGTTSDKSIRMKVEVAKHEDEEGKTITIFQRDAEVIFEFALDNNATDDDVIGDLVMQLPVAISCKLIRNNLIDLKKV